MSILTSKNAIRRTLWRDGTMIISDTFEITYITIAFALLGAILIGALLTALHLKRKYHPNLIGAILGALLCFAIIEAMPMLAS
jgi:uncharacterized membrane protein YeaQ/YmgE (transglycosylase-associated protein family)